MALEDKKLLIADSEESGGSKKLIVEERVPTGKSQGRDKSESERKIHAPSSGQ
jgi:hypothetical protein